jgi:DNA polymerase elongation subunit (family B)
MIHLLTAGSREFARVFGVDFFSVISRGSQFKVESFMFRIAKPESFVLRSPNKHQVRNLTLQESRGISELVADLIGWRTKCGRMYAPDNGAIVCVL